MQSVRGLGIGHSLPLPASRLRLARACTSAIVDGSSGSSCTGSEVTNVPNSKAKDKDQRQSESKVMLKRIDELNERLPTSAIRTPLLDCLQKRHAGYQPVYNFDGYDCTGLVLDEYEATVSTSHGLSWNPFHTWRPELVNVVIDFQRLSKRISPPRE
ncbi:hypothetical protein KC333_g22 [Hortaea werneckii]|nr:hypothetical protein KC333_g22 [Hortaea werneckii]